jgi:hypothetical protein
VFTIIRTDGTGEVHGERPTMAIVLAAIGAPALDTVRIGRANTPPDDQIMLVDDTGALRDLSVHAKARRSITRCASRAIRTRFTGMWS